MLINNLITVQDIYDAWTDIALDLDTIKDEVYSRLKDKKYQNEEERETLEEINNTLEDVIDWENVL